MLKNLLLFTSIASAVVALSTCPAPAQSKPKVSTVTLEARRVVDGRDNYTRAAFSFIFGANGDAAVERTRTNWDILFGNGSAGTGADRTRDTFDVTMVTDDRSKIVDLGPYTWDNVPKLPSLPAYPVPTRDPSVAAEVGHMYLVHSSDRDSDHYSLFRVESIVAGKSVTITWKLVSTDLIVN